MEITYRALKNVMLDYALPHLADYKNNLDRKQTANASSKKSKKKRKTQIALPSASPARPVEPVAEPAPFQEDIEMIEQDHHQDSEMEVDAADETENAPTRLDKIKILD